MKKISIHVEAVLRTRVEATIKREDRLDELIFLEDLKILSVDEPADILITAQKMFFSPCWDNQIPPLVFPSPVPMDESVLLGGIFLRLGNSEKAAFYLANHSALLHLVEYSYDLRYGNVIDQETFQNLDDAEASSYATAHNRAILAHYGMEDQSFESIEGLYSAAIEAATADEQRAFSSYHYAILLADADQNARASEILFPFMADEYLSGYAVNSIRRLWLSCEIKQPHIAADPVRLGQLKAVLSDCLTYFEQHDQQIEQGFLLLDAAYVVSMEQKFSEALGYLTRAISIFEAGELIELVAQAQFEKGKLLYAWAQNGNPQFFREAMKACQQALAVFTREQAPNVFADIHHQLGRIYAEVPDESKKKHIWAAVSVASFQEALSFYNKTAFPYMYGVICTDQGNAYSKYPMALHTDNYEKALHWYREALSVRDAVQYPVERAITLLNYLEACWNLGIEGNFDEELFSEMTAKANEITMLPIGKELKDMANQNLQQLSELKNDIANVVEEGLKDA